MPKQSTINPAETAHHGSPVRCESHRTNWPIARLHPNPHLVVAINIEICHQHCRRRSSDPTLINSFRACSDCL